MTRLGRDGNHLDINLDLLFFSEFVLQGIAEITYFEICFSAF